jgi:hypothetical protein
MKTSEKSTLALPLSSQVSQGHGEDHAVMPEEFAGIYQAGYETGLASGWESGYRKGYEAGFGDSRSQRTDVGAPSAVENVPQTVAGMVKARLFGLPCIKCRRWMYSDEARCAYCKTPRAAGLRNLSSATSSGPEEGSKRKHGGL